MSLRTKLTLTLLLSSFAAITLVGFVAYMQLMSRFEAPVKSEAVAAFKADAIAYYQAYGSWREAQAAMPFREFIAQRQTGKRPDNSPFSGNRPPIRFLLVTLEGRVVNGAGLYRAGTQLDLAQQKGLAPITVDGQVVGYMAVEGAENYTYRDREYIADMREALFYGVGAAAGLALVVGIGMGTGLSLPLRRLTRAAQAIEQGELRQKVAVRSSDEVGRLAAAFNRMSEELARRTEEVHENQRTIQEQADQLRELSIRDGLTQLHNRRHFDEQSGRLLEAANRDGKPVSIMLGDIDFFKKINDQFSHAVGDAVLRQVGQILSAHIRSSDLVARYGGEEFVVAFAQTSVQDAGVLCERLRKAIEDFDWTGIHPDLHVTISIGLAGSHPGANRDDVLRAADELLYRAKQSGRNRVLLAS